MQRGSMLRPGKWTIIDPDGERRELDVSELSWTRDYIELPNCDDPDAPMICEYAGNMSTLTLRLFDGPQVGR